MSSVSQKAETFSVRIVAFQTHRSLQAAAQRSRKRKPELIPADEFLPASEVV